MPGPLGGDFFDSHCRAAQNTLANIYYWIDRRRLFVAGAWRGRKGDKKERTGMKGTKEGQECPP